MGQKVHPLGFRVGITKKHQSQWFARFNKHKYAQSVLEDRMLRQTLTNLFPQLLNPVLKKQNALKKDKNEESGLVPKITQIKIERGLIPYEIGIQIHAENCDLIKKSIENLKVNRDLLCHLQKTRRYLQHLQLKLNDITTNEVASSKIASQGEAQPLALAPSGKGVSDLASHGPVLQQQTPSGKTEKRNKQAGRFRTRLTKQQLRRQRLILKRLRKRQSIRRRYKQLVYKGFLLTKKGNKVIQKLKTSVSAKILETRKERKKLQGTYKVTKNIRNFSQLGKSKISNESAAFMNTSKALTPTNTKTNIFKSRVKRKFVSVFINRMNKKFLQVLKNTLGNISQNSTRFSLEKTSDLPLGWNTKWNFNSVQKKLALKPLAQLTKLSTVLEQKSLKKMESLRKDYIASGLIVKTDALNYYQMLFFLKQLKELISQIKRKQKLQIWLKTGATQKNNVTPQPGAWGPQSVEPAKTKTASSLVQKLQSKGNVKDVAFNVLSNKLNNIENECRKIKFIEYLKQVVKKHRTDNIYLYLSTIADARKDLRKLQQFTKRNASFLFGTSSFSELGGSRAPELASTKAKLPLTNNKTTSNAELLTFERVSNVCKQSAFSSAVVPQKSDSQSQVNTTNSLPTLSDIFLEQIEKQRKMYKDNVQLTPKIAIKFYSVNSNALKAKASVVADSVVDALEKRKAFRKVIKDAKEDLMRTAGVKGVKIQVSGRLNGAEIARSEWVRAGRVPLQTLRANLDYSYKTANTIYGIIGIKVWIFKGYTKLI